MTLENDHGSPSISFNLFTLGLKGLYIAHEQPEQHVRAAYKAVMPGQQPHAIY